MVDAQDAFAAVARALAAAERQILILGWDLHSQVELLRGEDEALLPGWSPRLAPLLERAVERAPELQVHVLLWDFAMIYVWERESFPVFKLDWQTPARIRFQLDDRHPVGASHHQKIVVVDDRVAFCGGLDLCQARWDTREHAVLEARRTDPWGKPYPPFHDVHCAVSGPAAAALGDLARERWRRATGNELAPPRGLADAPSPWPAQVEAQIHDVPVAIARTEPAFDGREEVREIERLFVDSITAARECIYVENQYLTSWTVGEALEASLARAEGPEIVIVTQCRCTGWLEEASMGVLRTRLLRRLREADHAGRLHVYAARTGEDVWINVHAKVMVVDDAFFRAGSANLSNRSMGLDTECDLALEAEGDPERARAIRWLRDDLVAEHLGTTAEALREACEAAGGSLADGIERLRGGERTLEPLAEQETAELEALVPDTALLDPERPVSADQVLREVLPDDPAELVRHPILRVLGVVAVALGLAAAWRYTPLGEWLEPTRIVELGEPLRSGVLGPLAGALAFAVLGCLMVPLIALIVATALLYGPALGFAISLVGSVASAVASWALGRVMWRDTVRRLGGKRLNRLSKQLAERGVLAVAGIRMVPIAPYTVVNLVAGASHIRLRDFTLGTLLGIAPGAAALTLFSSQAAEAVREPDRGSLLLLAGAGLLLIAALWGGRRLIERRGER